MTRIIAAALVWLVLVGGSWVYLRAQDNRARQQSPVQEAAAVAGYRVELTPTFAAAPDPFALQLDTTAKAPALVARVNGQEVLRREETLNAGETLLIDPLPPVNEGTNEVYVEASPSGDEALQSHALRVRVMKGTQVVADETLWSEPGAALSAGVTFEASTAPAPEDNHAH